MSKTRPAILTALLLAATGAVLSGCVAYDGYDPYYPAYNEPVLVPPPTVYAVPPPVIVQPGYRYRPWRGDGWRPEGWRREWREDRGWHGGGGWRGGDHNGDSHSWGRPGGPRGWR